jgi:hypothetical protein
MMTPPPWNASPATCREYAINKLLTGPDRDRAEQIKTMLRTGTRREVGDFAIFSLQFNTLGLKPWVLPPSDWVDDRYSNTPGDDEMRLLIAKMRALKISLSHPDPMHAIEQAEQQQSAEAQHASRS